MNAFDKIYTENYTKMLHVAKKMVGDSDIASDIVQEVFIYLFDKLDNGKIITHINTWLYRATINKCIDNHRKQKRFQPIESIKDNRIDEEPDNKQETTDAINNALSKLKPQEKVLAVLYSEGLSYKEMAEAADIKFSSIGKMLSRTLEKLEKELKNHYNELY